MMMNMMNTLEETSRGKEWRSRLVKRMCGNGNGSEDIREKITAWHRGWMERGEKGRKANLQLQLKYDPRQTTNLWDRSRVKCKGRSESISQTCHSTCPTLNQAEAHNKELCNRSHSVAVEWLWNCERVCSAFCQGRFYRSYTCKGHYLEKDDFLV